MRLTMLINIKKTKLHLRKLYVSLVIFTCASCVFSVAAEEAELQSQLQPQAKELKKKATKTPYIIETLVQGSQEQPNVIYITPWQENGRAVRIQGQSLHVLLPRLAPVNPKTFKKQLNSYYQK